MVVLVAGVGIIPTACTTPSARSQNDALTELEVPDAWENAEVTTSVEVAWLENFDSQELRALVNEALEKSPLLHAMEARLDAADASMRIANGGRMPSLTAGVGANRQKTAMGGVGLMTSNTYNLGLNAAWEIDLWGILGDEAQASLAQYEAAGYDLDAYRLGLVVQVSRSFYSVMEARDQYALALESLKSFEKNLETVERRYDRGLVESLDVRLARAQAASSRAAVQSRKNQLGEAIRLLETLLGRNPNGSLSVEETLSVQSLSVPAGLPSEVIERRPDLRAAERRLASLSSLLRASSKNRFPRISLTASGGTASNELENLLDSDFSVWSLAGNIAAPLFQGGRLSAQQDLARAQYEEAVARYLDAVLVAFREVENALAAKSDLELLELELRDSAEESEAAEAQAWSLYDRGLVDISTVLQAQQRKVSSRSEHLSVMNRLLQNRIQLYSALGGPF